MLNAIQDLLQKNSNASKASQPRFFKVGHGEYAEHDRFLGITVPVLRTIAREFAHNVSELDIKKLLQSSYNEERLLALFFLIDQYRKGTDEAKHAIYNFYIAHMQYVNNWNLVDASAHEIIGAYLFQYNRNQDVLMQLVKSDNLWNQRVGIVATWYFIKHSDTSWTYDLAEKFLLINTHDLIQKAVGWMLREAGKKDEQRLRMFLDRYATQMPRTMLRYAIEKFSPDVKKIYMKRIL